MAKIEKNTQKKSDTSNPKIKKSTKAKKRKNTPRNSDDEVEQKVFVIGNNSLPNQSNETHDVLESEKISTSKTIKRRNETEHTKKKKRTKIFEKLDNSEKGESKSNKPSNDIEMHDQNMEELLESIKPEDINAILTARKAKKLKNKNRVEHQKTRTVENEKLRVAEYLLKWKNKRSLWKFEKLRQIYIQQSALEEDKISNDIWPIALEYLCGTKGASRDLFVKSAQDLIEQIDNECSNLSDEMRTENIQSTKYHRAREILQILT